jgi:copper resistance protein C
MWALLLGAALLLAPVPASGHVFPDHSDPPVGHTLRAPPSEVRIWFDGELEPVFSTIRVENARRERVDKGDGRVDSRDPALLEISLSPLPPGKYRVFWSAVARDGHRTEGDFPFQVE